MNKTDQSLRESLKHWEDADIVAYKLGCAIGIFPPEDGSYSGFRASKHLFWGSHPLGVSIGGMLDVLVQCGVLEHNRDTGQFRWNADFKVPEIDD